MIKQKLPKEWNKPDPTELRVENFFNSVWKFIKKERISLIKDMMYNTKEKDKSQRFMAEFYWLVKIVGVFFALKGITYWLTGR